MDGRSRRERERERERERLFCIAQGNFKSEMMLTFVQNNTMASLLTQPHFKHY
jgi:hypothetical protein